MIPILVESNKQQVRVFRPVELTAFIECIVKETTRIVFKAMLYTAARYEELVKLHKNKKWFDYESGYIHLTREADKKVFRQKRTMRGRYIRLNRIGAECVRQFLNLEECPTHRELWGQLQTAKRNFKAKGYDDIGISPKSTRKTYECFLFVTFRNAPNEILLSVGHRNDTALEHYLQFGFTSEDKQQMKPYVEGWLVQ